MQTLFNRIKIKIYNFMIRWILLGYDDHMRQQPLCTACCSFLNLGVYRHLQVITIVVYKVFIDTDLIVPKLAIHFFHGL
ncbi:hypothetical protein D3C87_2059040 [compost metagenome]